MTLDDRTIIEQPHYFTPLGYAAKMRSDGLFELGEDVHRDLGDEHSDVICGGVFCEIACRENIINCVNCE
jgi:hypothetical protein